MILASDYDGTLHVDEEQTLRNLEAVAEWRKKGHQFGLVTGRSYEMALLPIHEYHLPLDFLICNNGAAIYRLDGAVIEHSPMSKNAVKEFFRLPVAGDFWNSVESAPHFPGRAVSDGNGLAVQLRLCG